MARLARADVFDPHQVSVFHCIQRCVRRCFLCGNDPYTGRNFDHRKAWLEDRLRELARWFGIDVLEFAILSNHFHVIVRNRPDVVETWSDHEVARRWLMICPLRKTAQGTAEEPTPEDLQRITNDPQKLIEIRTRLSDISWFMRLIAGPMARRANREDQTTGRFWQGRFKAVKLCDDGAILGCSIYVDLNVIRAGLAQTPETSDFTSAQRRIQAMAYQAAGELPPSRCPDDWLAPLFLDERAEPGPMPSRSAMRCSDKGFLPVTLSQYLKLLDWSGRQVVEGKRGAIPEDLAPILQRLGISSENWLTLALEFGRLFHRVAGSYTSLSGECHLRTGHPFRPGQAHLLSCGLSVIA